MNHESNEFSSYRTRREIVGAILDQDKGPSVSWIAVVICGMLAWGIVWRLL